MEGEEDETEDDSDSEDIHAHIVAGDMGTLRIRGQVELTDFWLLRTTSVVSICFCSMHI